jgi:uncharacterized iron-regulated membrane protein
MEEVILTAGQSMLLLAAVTCIVAMVCAIIGMLRWLVRTVRAMGSLDRPVDRPTLGGGMRKW